MSTRFTRADLMEVPLPSSGSDGVCMPMVIMQPTADASDYMLKPNYATNGRPGVVDHAVVADQANTVVWNQITNLPSVFPPAKHAYTHLDNGTDAIPIVTTSRSGLVPMGTGQPNDYFGGDLQYHNLQSLAFIRSEGDASLDPSLTAGSTIFTGIVPNPAYGNYTINSFYLYNANPAYPPAGKVHFGIYDPAIPGWVQCTDSADISVLTGRYSLLRPPLNVTAMNRVFGGAGNAFQWRLVLDVPSGTASYMRVGAGFLVLLFANPLG